jgi:phage tail-like protein
MRGLVSGLRSPHPLGPTLPGVYIDEARREAPGAGNVSAYAPPSLPYGTYTATIADEDLAGLPEEIPVEARGELKGVWVLDLHEDADRRAETIAMSLFRNGQPDTTGTSTLSGDLLALWTASCGSAEGSYKWRFDGDSLTLTCLEDTCSSRRFLLTAHRWQLRNLAMRLMAAFDEALAPVFCTLDNLDAYVDPRLAPTDFVDWLSGWIGLAPTQTWPLRRRRDRIARAVTLARSWGTAWAIKEVVSAFAGVGPENVLVVENGAVAVSATAGGELPGRPVPELTVRVKVPDPSQIDIAQLKRVVKGAKPADMLDKLEVVKL